MQSNNHSKNQMEIKCDINSSNDIQNLNLKNIMCLQFKSVCICKSFILFYLLPFYDYNDVGLTFLLDKIIEL